MQTTMTINDHFRIVLKLYNVNKQFAVPYKVESPIFWLVPVNF